MATPGNARDIRSVTLFRGRPPPHPHRAGAFFSSPFLIGCKEGHKFVKKITKKDKKGDESFDKGEYQIAIDSWWEAMNADMSLLAFVRPTLLKVVKAHVELKEYDKAIEEARKHVNNEESVEGLHALGGAQLAGDMFEEAIRTYHRAHEIAVRDGRFDSSSVFLAAFFCRLDYRS